MGAPRLGAHMSIAGGFPLAVERARSVGATALQVFVKSAGQWRARPLPDAEALDFRQAVQAAGLTGQVLAHASYLVNLASPDERLWQQSLDAFQEELRRCAALSIPFLVVHPGSHMGAGTEAGLRRLTEALDAVLGRPSTEGTRVLLEITAGQGRCLGGSFEEIAHVLDRVRRPERVGACFDTCHALAAGYEFRSAATYAETFARLDGTIGLTRLAAVHLNDSVGALGSRLDRHAHIGRGQVGLNAFRLLLRDPRLRGIPMVIETEKGDDLTEDRENLAVLRSLLG